MKSLIRIWTHWKEIAQYIGDFQSRIILTLFYFTVLVPFGLFTRLFGDPLRVRPRTGDSNWSPRKAQDVDLPTARRQY